MGLTGAGSLMAGGSKHTKPDKAELILNNKVGPYGYMENKKRAIYAACALSSRKIKIKGSTISLTSSIIPYQNLEHA